MSQNNFCYTPIDELKELTIKELKAEEVHSDSIIWLRSIAKTFKIAGICFSCEDKDGKAIQLWLYN